MKKSSHLNDLGKVPSQRSYAISGSENASDQEADDKKFIKSVSREKRGHFSKENQCYRKTENDRRHHPLAVSFSNIYSTRNIWRLNFI